MNLLQRIQPIQLSRQQIDNHTVQSVYKAGYAHFTVKSTFSGAEKLDDLFFDIILKSNKNFSQEQHD